MTETQMAFEIETTGDVEPGTYVATLVAWDAYSLYELADGAWTRSDPGDGTEPVHKISWTFAMDDGQVVTGDTSTAWRSEAAKLRQWCKGLGIDFATTKVLNAEVLVGREGMITVGVSKSGYSRVEAVNPLPKAKA
jgi:hypothetical protein